MLPGSIQTRGRKNKPIGTLLLIVFSLLVTLVVVVFLGLKLSNVSNDSKRTTEVTASKKDKPKYIEHKHVTLSRLIDWTSSPGKLTCQLAEDKWIPPQLSIIVLTYKNP